MFVLGIRSGKVATKPYISKLATNNARKGFFEYDQFQAVLAHLPDDIKPVVEVAYLTGWRIDSEILTRQRHHLDLKAGWLRLDPNESKNREGRMFPLTPRLREVLEKQIAKTEALQKELGKIIPHLFHRNGAPAGAALCLRPARIAKWQSNGKVERENGTQSRAQPM